MAGFGLSSDAGTSAGGALGGAGVGNLNGGLSGGLGVAGAAAEAGAQGLAGAGSAGANTRGASACSAPQVRVTEIDVGAPVNQNEDEAALKPLAISAIPAGGSRVAWLGMDAKIHVTTLKTDDTVDASVAEVSIAGMDYSDLYADATGGVLLLTRDAKGGGTLNCGEPTNLCGTPPSPAIACYDMYLVRFDGAGETWATELTQSSATQPPYLTSKTGPSVIFIWWYAHHGRIASDGTNYAAYFGAAISVSQEGCVNIHQGDEMRVVSPSGALLPGHQSFDWGCSHSGYERIVWDPRNSQFVSVCKNDAATAGKSGRLAFAPKISTIYPLDLFYSNVGNLTLGGAGGYWLTTSDIRPGQIADSNGLADVHLLHFQDGAPDKDSILASDPGLNDRAPHLTQYGARHLLAAWDTSTSQGDLTQKTADRQLYVQTLDSSSGAAVSAPISVPVRNNRYQEMKAFPDGSVAYPAPGSSTNKLKILRVLPCE
ncbi:MAG: hypothetical protein WDO74_02255 [Pseudomonadota bacterium]